jgi:hypothetical protein
MTVIFVAPDDSDDEDIANCEAENHLQYKFITDETEHIPKQNDSDSIHRIKDLTISNGVRGKSILEQTDETDSASIDSSQRYHSLN